LKIHFLLLCLLPLCALRAQTGPRILMNMDEGWQFAKGDSAGSRHWQGIRLPHTWNADDVMDDVPGYYRGAGWYKKTFRITPALQGKNLSLFFEGANQQTEVYVNGKKAGAHTGGYTGFTIPITALVNRKGDNEISVRVDNNYNAGIAPLSADFSFYGGIYRDVFLVATSDVHLGDPQYGSRGVYVTTPSVSRASAQVNVSSRICNDAGLRKKIIVTNTLYRNGSIVSSIKKSSIVDPHSFAMVAQQMPNVAQPALWSPEEPNLYTLKTVVDDGQGRRLDEVTTPVGFRWFRFSADSGFFLNGAPYKLIGASRHQDYKGLGNAVPDSLAINDLVLLKKMGASFLRVAHYPQDPCVLAACDSLGLIASVEIPVVNEITESDTFYRNCETAQTEMIRQNFNHPSVVLWCYMNEILLRPHFGDNKERQKVYFDHINALARRLENLTRREDPYRYTLMADHGNLAQYKNTGLLEIPMVIGWNLYSGWYGGNIAEFGRFLDEFHAAYPRTPFLVSEYGADADPRIRSSQPVRFDKSIEYTTQFHQYYLDEMMKRPFVAGAVVWNLADFNSETRTETMPHINNKGLLQWDRTPKDPYYFYCARLAKQPFIKILGSCQGRYGIADSALPVCYQPVQIASNLDSVTIEINGHAYAKTAVTGGLCTSSLPFREGLNTVIAEGERNGQRVRDSITTELHMQARNLKDGRFAFDEMNVLLGAGRSFVDERGGWWQPDQSYARGSWGSVGGKMFRLGNNRLPYGTDKDILGTPDDPVYQTQQTGIHQYRLDVPPGRYELTLHFAELLGGTVQIPPYNLADTGRHENANRRVFDVRVNGRPFLDRFNIADDYGLSRAVVRSTTVTVNDEEGIFIDFEALEGEPVLNALQIKKIAEDVAK